MPTLVTVVSLDDLPHVPGPGTLTWLPVRQTLGIRAFGTNAYVAAAAGEDVVEPDQESADPETDPASAHEELYFVARGHATFTIAGAEHDAPAGTYVFIPDPETRRQAREILGQARERFPDDGSAFYNLACLEALEGSPDLALARLGEAIERRPGCAQSAPADEDLATLRGDPRFEALVAGR